MSDYFKEPQHPVNTRQGEIALPIFYYNTACVFASFVVDTCATRQLLPAVLEPVVIAPGKSLATVAFFQYTDSSVGAYNEMGLAIAARPSRHHFHNTAAWHPLQSVMPGMFIVDLPVTTAIAYAAGRECWGYPKIVVPIDFSLRGSVFDCKVLAADRNDLLCQLRGQAQAAIPLFAPDLLTYTLRDGVLLRTVIRMRGRMQHSLLSRVEWQQGQNHHLCDHLQVLGLQQQRPVLLQYGQGLQAILPAGQAVQ